MQAIFRPTTTTLRTTSRREAEKRRAEGGGTGSLDFLLLDARGREAFDYGHITGSWCAEPGDELDQFASRLPKDKEIVTYCWVMIDSYPPRRLCSWQSECCS